MAVTPPTASGRLIITQLMQARKHQELHDLMHCLCFTWSETRLSSSQTVCTKVSAVWTVIFWGLRTLLFAPRGLTIERQIYSRRPQLVARHSQSMEFSTVSSHGYSFQVCLFCRPKSYCWFSTFFAASTMGIWPPLEAEHSQLFFIYHWLSSKNLPQRWSLVLRTC